MADKEKKAELDLQEEKTSKGKKNKGQQAESQIPQPEAMGVGINTQESTTQEDIRDEVSESEKSTNLEPKAEELNIDIGEKLSKVRYITPVVFMILMLFLSGSNAFTAFVGTAIIILGWMLRIYTKVYAGSYFDLSSESFGTVLVQEGPYKYVRNPMYISYIIIMTGLSLFSGSIIMFVLTPIYFAVQYFLISVYEESLLKEKNESYLSYEEEVPAWMCDPKGIKLDCPDMEKIIQAIKDDLKLVVAVSIVLLLFCVKAW